MEVLGKMFKIKNNDAVSVHQTTRYWELRQEMTDDERDDEDDDVVFLRKGIEVKQQNGIDVDHHKRGRDSEVELKPLRKLKPLSENVQVKKGVLRKRITRRRVIFVLLLLVVVTVAASALMALGMHKHNSKWSRSWVQEFMEFEATSNVVMHDVDSDGIQDIIISFTANLNTTGDELFSKTSSDTETNCMSKGTRSACLGRLVSLRGHDGEVLWETAIRYGLTEIKCDVFDIDGDKLLDCIAYGHLMGVMAFNPKTGRVIWTGNSALSRRDWMVVGFEALVDLTEDGVPEVVVVQSIREATEHKASNNTEVLSILLLVDGSSGDILGQPLKLTDEVRFSPMLLTFKDESTYILYGTGSEDEKGSLFALSLKDFYSMAMKPLRPNPLTIKGSYSQFLGFNKKGDATEIFRSSRSGLVASPLLVDVDNDGADDILVASYDGRVTLLNGSDGKVVWTQATYEQHKPGKLMAGYFDEDEHPDILVHLSSGPQLNLTSAPAAVAVLSGQTGSLLWILNNSAVGVIASELIASTADDRRDFFMFWIREQELHERSKRHIRSDSYPLPSGRTRFSNPREQKPSYEDYLPGRRYKDRKRLPLFDLDSAYNPDDSDYRQNMDYDSDPEQPLPSRRRPYQSEFYNHFDPADSNNNNKKSNLVALNGHTRGLTTDPTTSVALPRTIQTTCRPQADRLTLVGIDRYSTMDPFVIFQEDSISRSEMDGLMEESHDHSSTALKSDEKMPPRRCFSAVVESISSMTGDFDNDHKLDLVSMATLSSTVQEQNKEFSRSSKKLRVSKFNLELKILDTIKKRLESLVFFIDSFTASTIKSSRPMIEKDLNHFSDFKFGLHRDQGYKTNKRE